MKKNAKLYIFDIIILMIIGGFLYISISYNSDYPGLYLDSVNPDYAGVQLLTGSSGAGTYIWAFSMFNGFPILPQMYHGAVTTITTIISCLITGSTSVFQVHAVNAVFAFIVCVLTYYLLKQYSNNHKVAALITVLLATTPSLNTILRCQYYIKLPGTALILGALYLLLSVREESVPIKRRIRIMVTAFLAGFAFYSYFHYLFFAPAFLWVLWCKIGLSSYSEKAKMVLLFLTAYCIGALGYFVGYAAFLLQNEPLVWMLIVAMLLVAVLLIFTLVTDQFRGKKAIAWIVFIGLLFGVVGIGIISNISFILEKLGTVANGLNIAGETVTAKERILLVFQNWGNILSGRMAETLIFQETFSIFPHLYAITLFMMTVFSYICLWKSKNKSSAAMLMVIVSVFLISFVTFSVFFASRLGTQHFVPMLPLSLLLMGSEIVVIMECKDRINMKCIVAICLLLLSINFINNGLFQYKLGLSGGHGLFTSQINELAYDALENSAQGKKEVYVFEEWGFFAGFSYLTRNMIPYVTECGIDRANQYLSDGYDVIYCSWSEDGILDAEHRLHNDELANSVIEKRYCLDGKIAFYTLTLSSKID